MIAVVLVRPVMPPQQTARLHMATRSLSMSIVSSQSRRSVDLSRREDGKRRNSLETLRSAKLVQINEAVRSSRWGDCLMGKGFSMQSGDLGIPWPTLLASVFASMNPEGMPEGRTLWLPDRHISAIPSGSASYGVRLPVVSSLRSSTTGYPLSSLRDENTDAGSVGHGMPNRT